MKPMRAARGLSMIEIAIVLLIVAILFRVAAPNFSGWLHNTQVRTASESIVDALQLARSEAMRRNRSVMFWITSQAAPPAADWLVGCSIPVGAGVVPEAVGDCPGSATGNGVPPPAPPTNWISRQAALDLQTPWPQVVTTPAGATVVTFNSLGMVAGNADGTPAITRFDIIDPTIAPANARPLRIVVSGGNIRMCDPTLAPGADARAC
jgi:type IV fimbrial biogenesis protein FimT